MPNLFSIVTQSGFVSLATQAIHSSLMPSGHNSAISSRPAHSAHSLWRSLNNPKMLASSNFWNDDEISESSQRSHLQPHLNLDQHIQNMPFLPLEIDPNISDEVAVQQFKNTLAEARILAQGRSIIWGCDMALGLLKVAGSETVIQAYDHADQQALNDCSLALTVVRSDQLVRARLGAVVEFDQPLVDKIKLCQARQNATIQSSELPVLSYYDIENKLAIQVNLNDPDYHPANLLVVAARNYHDMRVINKLQTEDIARLVGQTPKLLHLKMFYALYLGSIALVCRSLHPSSVSDKDLYGVGLLVEAFEQCCQQLGEDFMLQTLYGKTSETSHPMLVNQRLRLILPHLKKFLLGDKATWG